MNKKIFQWKKAIKIIFHMVLFFFFYLIFQEYNDFVLSYEENLQSKKSSIQDYTFQIEKMMGDNNFEALQRFLKNKKEKGKFDFFSLYDGNHPPYSDSNDFIMNIKLEDIAQSTIMPVETSDYVYTIYVNQPIKILLGFKMSEDGFYNKLKKYLLNKYWYLFFFLIGLLLFLNFRLFANNNSLRKAFLACFRSFTLWFHIFFIVIFLSIIGEFGKSYQKFNYFLVESKKNVLSLVYLTDEFYKKGDYNTIKNLLSKAYENHLISFYAYEDGKNPRLIENNEFKNLKIENYKRSTLVPYETDTMFYIVYIENSLKTIIGLKYSKSDYIFDYKKNIILKYWYLFALLSFFPIYKMILYFKR